MKNIILIGFMGVGKGSTAREIVKQSKIVAIDTDDIIESMEGRSVKKIFEFEGEAYFRELEQRVAFWLQNSVRNTLISTGGGFYKVSNLKNIGKIVLLDASFDGIYQRILNHPQSKKKLRKRPLFQDIKKAKELYKSRVSEYKKIADIVINVENKPVEKIASEILKKVKK